MEQIIIIGLLIIIILILLERKFSIDVQRKNHNNTEKKLPSIMGRTKHKVGQALPIGTDKGQDKSYVLIKDNFNSETKEEIPGNVVVQKNIDDILVRNDEWGPEEEDWKYEDFTTESGFATGVTFQELSTAGQLLQQKDLEPDLEKQAVDIIQKIQGTELFDLLENSLGDATKRIASLLNQSISNDDQIISSKRSISSEGFDIGEFI
ncbi:hypothetical protein ODZ84_00220 [Chryseobacterium fluminis]|uniref:hypothetical protein n=1 Tax=Chryseobacterium fluminis TaxID=2983606 RepID=UPI00224CDBB6|nr:hypothetical protein [Chryseobacterium sp. MMS21-Ot14]UZT98032.1 hypothetical protein ODZ84_00220 [Chryseobacterium sp. MMS21-Ot14]